MTDSFWAEKWDKILKTHFFQFQVKILQNKYKKIFKCLKIDMYIFLAIKIWPLVTFSNRLEQFCSKIAQWDSN